VTSSRSTSGKTAITMRRVVVAVVDMAPSSPGAGMAAMTEFFRSGHPADAAAAAVRTSPQRRADHERVHRVGRVVGADTVTFRRPRPRKYGEAKRPRRGKTQIGPVPAVEDLAVGHAGGPGVATNAIPAGVAAAEKTSPVPGAGTGGPAAAVEVLDQRPGSGSGVTAAQIRATAATTC